MAYLGDILVLGLGSSGRAAARYCASLIGEDVASVTAVDASDAPALRDHAEQLASLGVRVALGVSEVDGRYDTCIASPGIAPHAPLMASARAVCGRVVSEIEFAFERSSEPWVAITGTNGKTTTTALTTHLLVQAGIPARSVGNIGTPAIEAVAEKTGSVLVAEVSSFQLALTEKFHPRVAVLLNVTPDHIDWHGSMERYASDKGKVFANLTSGDCAVIDVDDAGSAPFADSVASRAVPVVRVSLAHRHERGAVLDDGVLALDTPAGEVRLISADDLLIRGAHNVSNALAAAAAAHAMGAGAEDLRRGLATFEPIEHRLEPCGYACGAEWFNDSKATNPDAVFKAVSAFDDRPFIVLLGGRNKGNDFCALATEVASTARAAVTFGEAGNEIADAFGTTGMDPVRAATLAEAVRIAAGIAEPGDAVVLSPACASFDEFANYEQRGAVFKTLVRDMECAEGGAS